MYGGGAGHTYLTGMAIQCLQRVTLDALQGRGGAERGDKVHVGLHWDLTLTPNFHIAQDVSLEPVIR